MSGGYIRDTILSKEAIEEAKEYYRSKTWDETWQYFNLFHMQRIDIPTQDYDLKFLKELHTYSRKSHNIGCYFLKYVPGSFCRIHMDNDSEVTTVTLLESNNLVGGECLIEGEYQPPTYNRPSDHTCKRCNQEVERPPYGLGIVPDIVKLKDGESMVYGPELRHGVTRVYEGERVVLIAWFKNGERTR